MIDPITGISFALGVLGLLASSIQSATSTVFNFSEAASILGDYIEQLSTSRQLLRSWKSLWFYSDEVLDRRSIYLWGLPGYRDLRTRLESIGSAEQQLLKLLKAGADLTTSQRSHWEKILRRCRDAVTRNKEPELSGKYSVTLIQRIVFSLAMDSSLKNAVTRYKDKVAQLETISNINYNIRNGCQGRHAPTRDRIEQTVEAASIADEFAQRLAEHFALGANQYKHWSLVMDLMSNIPGDCHPKEAGQLEMRFLISGQQRYSLVRARWLYHVGLLDRHHHSTPAQLLGPIHGVLLSANPDRRTLQNTMIARAKAALCIATWVTLLWDSRWMRGIKSSSIHYAVNASRQPKIDSPITYEHPECLRMGGTTQPDLYDRQVDLLLGILLAELAIGRPIRLRDKMTFEVEYGSKHNIMTLSKLLEAVNVGVKSRAYVKAVKHCFLASHQDGADNRAGRIAQYVDEVVKPLQTYYDALHMKAEMLSRSGDQIGGPNRRLAHREQLQQILTDGSSPTLTISSISS